MFQWMVIVVCLMKDVANKLFEPASGCVVRELFFGCAGISLRLVGLL